MLSNFLAHYALYREDLKGIAFHDCTSSKLQAEHKLQLLIRKSFQNAIRAFWDEARKGFGVHWCLYTNGRRSPYGLRDAHGDIDVQ